MLKQLSDLQPCQSGTVRKVAGDKVVRRRMLDMGLVNGAEVRVKRVAPLGDPIEIAVRGGHLSIRANVAQSVSVEPLP